MRISRLPQTSNEASLHCTTSTDWAFRQLRRCLAYRLPPPMAGQLTGKRPIRTLAEAGERSKASFRYVDNS